jgi:hypothetical protein
MARADLLLDIVRAGAQGDQALFRKALEATIAEERAKQHNILADRLAGYLNQTGLSKPLSTPALRNGLAANLFYEISPVRGLSDLILTDSVVFSCEELLQEQARADILRSHNLEPVNRVLLAGPPGNGKTSLAEAIASELGIPLLVVRYEGVIASYLGETAVRLSRLFEEVRTRRCVLFFDEFDVVGKERGDIHETGEIKRVVSSLLLQVDALPSYVVVITATNHPELLDRAVWRRFQLRLELPAPTQKQVEEWFLRFGKSINGPLGMAASTLAKHMKDVSYSELEQFSLDVRRRLALSQPEMDTRRAVKAVLQQWDHRYILRPSERGDRDA